MGIFGGGKKSSSESGSGSGGSTEPQYRVEFTNGDGFNSVTAFTAESAEMKASDAEKSGAKNVSINPFKRGR